ncbi:MAG: magnesium transporter CorA family protein [Chloroflexi bacterium]|nr:magnesium transporter CorA family protein [Chloroflexota bacterium]
MMRSLVAPAVPAEGEDLTLRRNLSEADLEAALECGDLLWLDFSDATEAEITWLERVFKLHPAVVTDLKREDRRPTLLAYPDYLFLSLFQPRIRLNKVMGEEIHCIIGEQFFITVRKDGKSAVDSAYERAAQIPDNWRGGTAYLLYLTAQFVVDAYYPLLDRISNQLNEMEEAILMNGRSTTQKSVFRIKQQLIELRQMVAPQREVLSNVIGEERVARTGESRDLFRHLYERLLRIYDVIDAQRDLTSNILDLIESQEAAKLGNAVNRLTILSMIFLPLTFITGLFGLNFVTTDPEFRIPLSGALVMLFIIMITLFFGAVLIYMFRRRGWL